MAVEHCAIFSIFRPKNTIFWLILAVLSLFWGSRGKKGVFFEKFIKFTKTRKFFFRLSAPFHPQIGLKTFPNRDFRSKVGIFESRFRGWRGPPTQKLIAQCRKLMSSAFQISNQIFCIYPRSWVNARWTLCIFSIFRPKNTIFSVFWPFLAVLSPF